jgi:hypothetical protein
MKRHRLPFTADLTPFFDRLTMHLPLLHLVDEWPL